MIFFSGFSLKEDEHFFKPYIKQSDFTVCGFSYGAIKAFEYVQQQLRNHRRVDTLQLFSPAFFQNKDAKFKRLQIMGYTKDKQRYLETFVQSCFAPNKKQSVMINENDTETDLQKLLEYEWDLTQLQQLIDAGVQIEVYLGGNDRVISAINAFEFFTQVASVTLIKKANHFLQGENI